MKTNELLLALDEQRKALATNLSTKGIATTGSEGLEILVPKILDIQSGSSDVLFWDISSPVKERSVWADWGETLATNRKELAKLINMVFVCGDGTVYYLPTVNGTETTLKSVSYGYKTENIVLKFSVSSGALVVEEGYNMFFKAVTTTDPAGIYIYLGNNSNPTYLQGAVRIFATRRK